MTQESADMKSYGGGGVVVQEIQVSLHCDGESRQGLVSLVSSYNLCPKPTTYTTLKLLSHGMTRVTLMIHRLLMATFLMILQRKKPSSIIVTTQAVRLTSQMIKLTSRNMMLTYRMVNCQLTSIVAVKTYRISSMASSSMKKQVCITMVRGIMNQELVYG